jgi:hypothetical protein
MQGADPRTLRTSIKVYRELASRQPDNPLHREKLGRLYLLEGRRDRGLAELEHAARLRAARGDFAGAIELARELVRLDRTRTSAALLLAQLYAQAPEMAKRVSVAAAVESDPLDDLGRAGSDPPLDASSLVAVHEPDDLGAEVDDVVTLSEDDLEPLEAPIAPAPDTRAHAVLKRALSVVTTLDSTMTAEAIDEDDILQIVELVPDDE